MKSINVGIYGGTGYTGWALIQLLLGHPEVTIQFVTSERLAGKSLKSTWPLAPDILLQASSEVDLQQVDCVFLCLPHTHSAKIAAKAKKAKVAVIDLSADLRLNTAEDFEYWYKVPHTAPELLPVVFGLPEHYREQIKKAKLVANPGCYATAMLLGLLPLAQTGSLIENMPIIVDAKSGTSGAGRNPKQNIIFSEVHGNFSPYNIGRAHRHIGEVEQQLATEGLKKGRLIFSPHLLPTDRGILAAIYAPVKDAQQAITVIQKAYQPEPLVTVLPEGELATLAHVVRTPSAALSLTPVTENSLIIMVAIDNLLKGAASQAVQNFNLVFGFDETTALLTAAQGAAK
ncbi:MAG: N-acetyl-gamma-glutamyl-phosphate reductase [Chloroflexota bacterium]